MKELRIKRIYEAIEEQDGYRVLTDRLWPRGIAKAKAAIDLWEKTMAPSTELREWFGHIPERFPEFTERYLQELEDNSDATKFVELCQKQLEKSNVTLLYGAKDEVHNQAVVLQNFINQHLRTK
jgi:transcriptional regulator, MarR family